MSSMQMTAIKLFQLDETEQSQSNFLYIIISKYSLGLNFSQEVAHYDMI